ncbi:hypothetical protein SK128_025686 [Halocaridina rubra]|uniref:BTB domain-containing protein n=1 Tax=Halocaridina rubra TaxID=373956 RepID=A0AAN8X1J5_HALRR
MDPNQQFCLRWNNYQSTLQHVFYKLWISGTFVDASLVVDGRRIDCHKVVLSACSSYFEDILQEHGSQSHPLILLHDMPFSAVEALVAFMYRGEVNVTQSQLSSLLQVAEALKIKGLADSAALSNFTKRQFLERCLPLLEQSPGVAATAPPTFIQNRYVSLPGAVTFPTAAIVQPRMVTSTTSTTPQERNISPVFKQTAKTSKRIMKGNKSPTPKKRRMMITDRGLVNLPTSPDSVTDTPMSDRTTNIIPAIEPSQPSPPPSVSSTEMIKLEAADETEGELLIDESAGQSPAGSSDSETQTRSECDKQERSEEPNVIIKEEPCKVVKVEQTQTMSVESFPATKERKSVERTYTHLDLEQGIEAVLLGRLTPAKAIAYYRIPRRTFFRRLSAVRKSRGIPSAKENAADQFLNSSSTITEASELLNSLSNESHTGSGAAPFKVKAEKQLLIESKDSKAKGNKKNTPPAASPNTPNSSYLHLLKLASSNNYDVYIKYLRMVAQQNGNLKPEELLEVLKRGQFKDLKQTIDDNRNVATDVSEAALCLVNKNVPTEVPEAPLSLVNGKNNSAEVPEEFDAPLNLVGKNVVAEVPEDKEMPVNLCNGNGAVKRLPGLMVASENTRDEVEKLPKAIPDLIIKRHIHGTVSEETESLVTKNVATPTKAPQNLLSRKLTTEVS